MDKDILEKIKAFFSKYPLAEYNAGQILIFPGDEAKHVFLLLKGRVKMTDVTYRGDEIIIHMFHAPLFFPMSMVLNNKRSPYIYQADTDITVYKAPAKDVDQFVRENADVTYTLMKRIYEGTDVLLDRIGHLMTSDAQSRLMFEIMTAGVYYGTTSKNTCEVKLRERELAARTGLSRETVSRELKKLTTKGLISYKSSIITIHDLEKFKKAINPNQH